MKCKIFFLLILSVTVLIVGTVPSFASPAVVDRNTFNNLLDDGKYLSNTYRDNYSLDLRECTLLEKGSEALNGLDNAMFQYLRNFAYVTIVLIDVCFNFNVASLFGSQIHDLQKIAKETIFDELFGVAFCFAAVTIIRQMARRNLIGAYGEILKVILVSALSVLLVTHSSTILTGVTSITRDVSVGMITKAVGDDSSGFSKDAAGVLWSIMVHRPFVDLEGGSIISDAQISSILSMTPGSSERIAYIKSLNASNNKLFGLDWPGVRLGKLLLLMLPLFVKNLTFIALGILQVVFQVFGMFLFFVAPLVLLYAVAAGPHAIENWIKRLLETQISIIILTMVMVVLIKLDQLLYQQANALGWLVVLIIQTGICIFSVFRFNVLLGLVSGLMHGKTPVLRIPDSGIPPWSNAYPSGSSSGSSKSKKTDKDSDKTSPSDGPNGSDTGPDSPSPTPTPSSGSTINMREVHQKHIQQLDRPTAVQRYVSSSGATESNWSRGPGNMIILNMSKDSQTNGSYNNLIQQKNVETNSPKERQIQSEDVESSQLKRPLMSGAMVNSEQSLTEIRKDNRAVHTTIAEPMTEAPQPQEAQTAYAVNQTTPKSQFISTASKVPTLDAPPITNMMGHAAQNRVPIKMRKS